MAADIPEVMACIDVGIVGGPGSLVVMSYSLEKIPGASDEPVGRKGVHCSPSAFIGDGRSDRRTRPAHENIQGSGLRTRSVCAGASLHQKLYPEEPDCLLPSLFPGRDPGPFST